MMLKNNFKDKACEISASEQESFFNLLSFCEQIIQEEAHKTVFNLSCEQNVFVDSHENDSDVSCENDSDSSHETSDHLQNSNIQDNSDFSDSQFMFLKKLHKCDEIL